MRYMMTDWQGRQVGVTESDVAPLIEMTRRLYERNDLVIWSLDEHLIRRVVGVVTIHETGTIALCRLPGR